MSTSPRSALGQAFSFDAAPADLARELDRTFAGLPAAPAGARLETIVVRPDAVIVGDQHYTVHPPRLMTMVANAVTSLAQRDRRPKLHAGAVIIDDRAVLLLGPSDSGKSTLTTSLALQGHELVSDELVAVDRQLRAQGLARPVRLDRGREHLFPELFRDRPTSPWATDNWHIAPGELGSGVTADDHRVGAIVVPAVGSDTPAAVTPIGPTETLVELVANVFPPLDTDGFTTLARLAGAVPCAQATYHTLTSGGDLVRELATASTEPAEPTRPEPAPATTPGPLVTWIGLADGSVLFDERSGRVVGVDREGTEELRGRSAPGPLMAEIMEAGFLVGSPS